jgi:predicted HicB family RNase H-like nuclease
MDQGQDKPKHINLRLPPKLHEQVDRLARQERRSMNSYITVVLERAVRETLANPPQ